MLNRTKARLLIVDDDALLRKMVSYLLLDAGYEVTAAESAAAATRVLAREEVHLLLLDVGMPGMDGLDFCRQLREAHAGVPILFLSARDRLDDKVAAFDAGGDDYLSKPFEPRELLARVRALLTRPRLSTTAGNLLAAGGLRLDAADLAVGLPGGQVAALTPTEFRVLHCLMLNHGRVVTRDHIQQTAWGEGHESESNRVDVYIRRLRRKIETEAGSSYIATVRGLGYRFQHGDSDRRALECVEGIAV